MSARVRAYYDVAATRFSDIICEGIVARLFPICSETLAKDLKNFIGIDKPEEQQKLKQWLTEYPAVTQQRQRLLEERKKLEAGTQYISNAMDPAAGHTNHRVMAMTTTTRRIMRCRFITTRAPIFLHQRAESRHQAVARPHALQSALRAQRQARRASARHLTSQQILPPQRIRSWRALRI
jgi:hypothetical protein